jgi:hypothetical protein
LAKVRSRKYIEEGRVVSLTGFFDVPKTDEDIHMVYDASKCGLNDVIWAPNFFIPSPDSLFRLLDHESWMADIDLGEFFLNFPLDQAIKPYAGVDLTSYFGKDSQAIWERWGRCLMGFKSSPYNTAQSYGWAEEVIKGNPQEADSPFHWMTVELNLLGSPNYNPTRPWVSKRRADGRLATDVLAYCDDLRLIGPTRDLALRAMRRVASIANYLGMQDAPRKRRFPDKSPGAWARTVAFAAQGGVFGNVSQERWDKVQGIISEIKTNLMKEKGIFKLQDLLSHRGYLVYVARSYPSMRPYLKVLHLTIDSWQPGRDKDGWKESDLYGDYLGLENLQEGAPAEVKAVRRLAWDMEALGILFQGEAPAVQRIRPSKSIVLKYGFGDASGTGFGSSFTHSKGVSYRIGVWGGDAEGNSSNYRELRNLVEAIEAEASDGNLANSEVFLFTDNTTAEAVYYRGTSKNKKKLFDLVLRLRRLEMEVGMTLSVIHVAGTRMISQGTDGLSRGNLLEGVMKGEGFQNFVPIHKSAMERSAGLDKWLRRKMGVRVLEVLEPKDWFLKGHDIRGWTPLATRSSRKEITSGNLHRQPQAA